MRRLIAIFLAILAVGEAQAALTPLPGATPQTSLLGQPTPNPVAFLVTDANGAPVPGAIVTYYQAPFDQELVFTITNCIFDLGKTCTTTADANGVARVSPAYVVKAGTWRAQFSSFYGSATIELTGVAGGPVAQLDLIEGDGQRIVLGSTSAPVRLKFQRNGVPLAGESVILLPQAGGPDFFLAEAQTDSNGIASIVLKPSLGYGAAILTGVAYDRLTDTHLAVRVNVTVTTAAGTTSFPIAPLWWAGEAQAGWGMSIAQRGDALFTVVFLYDENGRPTWVIPASSNWNKGFGSYIAGPTLKTRSSPWYAYDPSRFTQGPDTGNFILNFNDQPAGQSFLRLSTPYASVSTRMTPFDFSPAVAQAERGVSDIWWGGPSQDGWGISIAEKQGNLFIVWFTYDADSKPTWFVMSEGRWIDDRTWVGNIDVTTGSPITTTHPYDRSKFTEVQAGTFSIRFDDALHATFDYALQGRTGTLRLERFDY